MRGLSIFSRRKGKPDDAGAGETWRTGDMAECIIAGRWYGADGLPLAPGYGPEHGETRQVTEVFHDGSPYNRSYLGFRRYSSRVFVSSCFRKVVPQADAFEQADADFLGDLRDRVTDPSPELVTLVAARAAIARHARPGRIALAAIGAASAVVLAEGTMAMIQRWPA